MPFVADALSEVYGHLQIAYEAVSRFGADFEFGEQPSKEEQLQRFDDAYREFTNCIITRRLYVPLNLYRKSRDLGWKFRSIAHRLKVAIIDDNRVPTEDDRWSTEMDKLEHEADPLFSELVAEFQNRLGIKDHETPS